MGEVGGIMTRAIKKGNVALKSETGRQCDGVKAPMKDGNVAANSKANLASLIWFIFSPVLARTTKPGKPILVDIRGEYPVWPTNGNIYDGSRRRADSVTRTLYRHRHFEFTQVQSFVLRARSNYIRVAGLYMQFMRHRHLIRMRKAA